MFCKYNKIDTVKNNVKSKHTNISKPIAIKNIKAIIPVEMGNQIDLKNESNTDVLLSWKGILKNKFKKSIKLQRVSNLKQKI